MMDNITEEENEIFQSFLILLKSNETTKVPRETTLGAISHFISTLPSDRVYTLLEAISTSPRLWRSSKDKHATREAVQLGISEAINRLASQPGSSRWWFRKSVEMAWLDDIAGTTLAGEGVGKIQIMLAVLSATAAEESRGKKAIWTGSVRAEMEDEVIMGIASMLEDGSTTSSDADILCDALEVIDESKIRILDTKAIHLYLTQTLFRSLHSTRIVDESVSSERTSTAIARLYAILGQGDDDSRQFALDQMRKFCIDMRSLSLGSPAVTDPQPADHKPRSSTNGHLHPPGGIEMADKVELSEYKTALFALLPPLSSMLDVISHNNPPSPSDTSSPASRTDIALESLYTLSTFAPILAPLEGGQEEYHKVLHGMTDVLVATGGSKAVRRLLERAPSHVSVSPAEATWWLILGESVLHYVDQWGFDMVLEPMIDEFINDSSDVPSFEAAHSLRLATIRAAATDSERKDRPARLVERRQRDLIAYSEMLIEQYTTNKLTTDQFRAAYPLVVESASKYSDILVDSTLDRLRTAKAPTTNPEIIGQTRRLTIITCAAHIPCHRLRGYLDNVGHDILLTPINSVERREFNDTMYRMIMHDLGESGRLLGMEWWTIWRKDLQEDSPRMARL